MSVAAAGQVAPRTAARSIADTLRAEAAKLWSLPAVWAVLAGTLALTVLLSAAFASRTGRDGAVGVLDLGVAAIGWSQVGFFLLGVLAATSEYVGGQIRMTLIASPDRLVQRAAAVAALCAFALVAGALTVAASIGTVLVVTGSPVGRVDAATATRVILAAAGYLTLMAVLSCGSGCSSARPSRPRRSSSSTCSSSVRCYRGSGCTGCRTSPPTRSGTRRCRTGRRRLRSRG